MFPAVRTSKRSPNVGLNLLVDQVLYGQNDVLLFDHIALGLSVINNSIRPIASTAIVHRSRF